MARFGEAEKKDVMRGLDLVARLGEPPKKAAMPPLPALLFAFLFCFFWLLPVPAEAEAEAEEPKKEAMLVLPWCAPRGRARLCRTWSENDLGAACREYNPQVGASVLT